jgi:hypothetical protein
MARLAGERANDEMRKMVLANSGLRADVVIHSKPSILTDIRTSNSTDKKNYAKKQLGPRKPLLKLAQLPKMRYGRISFRHKAISLLP